MSDEALYQAQILIVDDEKANVVLLEKMLNRWGYPNLRTTTDPRTVLPLFAEIQPDLILLDLHMPHLDGFAVMEQLRPYIHDGTYLPILVLTADIAPETKRRALAAGAKDFLSKPFDLSEALLRIRNLLETRHLHRQLQAQNQDLEEKVRERTLELEAARIEILEHLARTAEFRDEPTGRHTLRVGRTSGLLARQLGLADRQVELIRRAAPLHDIGKVAIPDMILLKPGRLTAEEFDEMKTHTTIGANILEGSSFPMLRLAQEVALTHHERWDGTGYPRGLRGEAIPLAGRIVAVTDVFDALTHARPYKGAWRVSEALDEMRAQRGRHFDPTIVDAFLEIVERERIGASIEAEEALADPVEAAIAGHCAQTH